MDFDNINSFVLDDDTDLFFDIFVRDGYLHIISSFYNYNNPNFDEMLVMCNDYTLVLAKHLKHIETESFIILMYQISYNYNYEIKVIYRNKSNTYNLINSPNDKFNFLTLTTLCKNDYKLINIFYDYYKKEGVDFFYIYYNGLITNDIRETFNKPDIKLLQWNFRYWNDNVPKQFNHHSQPSQIHHYLYKYGKYETEYSIFNDLDEYLKTNENTTIRQYLINHNPDSVIFYNKWSETLDLQIPEKFPTKIYVDNVIENYRTKCIYKTNKVISIKIHSYRQFTSRVRKIINDTNNVMYHFYNWSSPERLITFRNKELYTFQE